MNLPFLNVYLLKIGTFFYITISKIIKILFYYLIHRLVNYLNNVPYS